MIGGVPTGGPVDGEAQAGGTGPGSGAERRADLERIVRELLALRRREVELLVRLEAWLAEAPRGRPAGETATGAAAAPPGAAEPGAASDGVSAGSAAGRAWLDEAVDAALRRAFSGSPSPEDAIPVDEAATLPAAAARPDPLAAPPAPSRDPDLLLLQSGEVRAAFPWEQVREIGLADEVIDGPAGASLRQYLNGGGPEQADEPYRISWETPDGVAALTCEMLGAVVPASIAASRGVELVLVPEARAGGDPCRVLTLVDYLATLVWPPDAGPAPSPAPTSAPAIGVSPSGPAASPPGPVPAREAAEDAPVGPPSGGRFREAPGDVAPRAERPRGPALVAVRYLPARVSISRVLRSLGWQAVQAPDNQELPAFLRQGRYEIIFAEPPDPLDPVWLDAFERMPMAGGRIVLVCSRVRGAVPDARRIPGDIPRLLHPFREGDIQRVLRGLFGPDAV